MNHSSIGLYNGSTLFCLGTHRIFVYGVLNHGTAPSISVFACNFIPSVLHARFHLYY